MVTPSIHPASRTFSFIGGLIGFVTFLFVGLLPSIVYGGFAGVTLASSILGGPIDSSVLARGLIVFGMVVGLLGAAGVFVVVGAAVGAGAHGLVRAVSGRPAGEVTVRPSAKL
jgi:hypothetical protein